MVDFYVTKKGHFRLNHDEEPEFHGVFTTWFVQNALLDYFTVGEIYVDAYDGAIFEGENLDQLSKQLDQAITEIRSKPIDWPMDSNSLEDYYSEGKSFSFNLQPPRDESLSILKRASDLAVKARQLNEKLIFCGD